MTAPIDPHVLESLRKYPEHHKDVTCLGCGYQGMMGIVECKIPFHLSNMLWYPLAGVLGGIMTAFGLFIVAFLIIAVVSVFLVLARANVKPIVECPSCRGHYQTS